MTITAAPSANDLEVINASVYDVDLLEEAYRSGDPYWFEQLSVDLHVSVERVAQAETRREYELLYRAHRVAVHGFAQRHISHCREWANGWDCMHLEGHESCDCAWYDVSGGGRFLARDSSWSDEA